MKGYSMRTGLIALAVIVLLAIVAVATGFVNLSGNAGELPKVAVEGGALPSVDADVPKVEVGTTKTEIDVPVVGVQKADGK
jgi:hypothetical protein